MGEVTSTSGFAVRGLYQGDDYVRDLMQGMVDEAGVFAPIFSDLWGAPPVEEIGYTTFSGRTPFAGTSLQGLIFLSDYIFTPSYSYLISAYLVCMGEGYLPVIGAGHGIRMVAQRLRFPAVQPIVIDLD